LEAIETIESIQRIIDWNKLDEKTEMRFVYRGMTNSIYKLLPKISRVSPNDENKGAAVSQTEAYLRYKKLKEYLSIRLPAYNYDFHHLNEHQRAWKELFVAQHYGAPTSLLDFTRNPLAGLFFACNGNFSQDGILYAICVEDQKLGITDKFYPDKPNYNIAAYDLFTNSKKPRSPESLKKYKFVVPPHFDPRIKTQESVFCVFPIEELTKPLDEQISWNYEGGRVHEGMNHVKVWRVPKEAKKRLMEELNWIGVNYASLFPDINGFGDFVTWKLMDFEMQ
jgi:hypothetical protein